MLLACNGQSFHVAVGDYNDDDDVDVDGDGDVDNETKTEQEIVAPNKMLKSRYLSLSAITTTTYLNCNYYKMIGNKSFQFFFFFCLSLPSIAGKWMKRVIE